MDIPQKSKFIANNIDTSSLNLLRYFSYGASGENNFWLRVSLDTNLYVCNYKLTGDTISLTTWRPHKFTQDFSTIFTFDTSVYSQFTFSKVKNKIVKIKMDSTKGNSLIKELSVSTEQIFPDKNPFITFSELNAIKNKYHFIGSSYGSELGDFFIFWFSPQFKLLYMRDTLKMDPKYKEFWVDEFKNGIQIKENWSLIDVYKK